MIHLEVDDQGWLRGPDASVVASKRFQNLWRGETHVLGIVWHYTDTRNAGAANLAKRIVSMPANGERSASWHACIDRGGVVAQSVSATLGSWHAGGPSAARFEVDRLVADETTNALWPRTGPMLVEQGNQPVKRRIWKTVPPRTGLPGANDLFFGVELENVGEVRYVNGEWLGWPFVRGDIGRGEPVAVPESEIVVGQDGGRHYHDFTARQVDSAQRVTEALALKYNLRPENCAFSHQMIDPERRTDPGPVWMERYLPVVLGAVFSK